MYNQLVRNTGTNLGLRLASEMEGGLVGLSPLPVESHPVSGVNRVRIEMNSQTLCRCLKIVFCCGEAYIHSVCLSVCLSLTHT